MITPSRQVTGGRSIADTVDSIRAVQLKDGMIPWFSGGHVEPRRVCHGAHRGRRP